MAINKEIIDVSVKGVRKAQSSLKGLGTTALKIGGAFFAAKGIVRGMSTVVQTGSKLRSVEIAFDNMGQKIGFSETSLEKLQKATDGTVSKLELMTKANNAMALGIVESDEQMANMFDTAQRLGKALGQDTASALDSLVTGMGRQSKLMLDNLGIMVDTEKAYDDYAESIGKSSRELTDQEKKIAFNQAAMNEANRIVNEMGEEQLTTADKLSKLKSTFSDMAASIGSDADGMFSSIVTSAQGVADKIVKGLDFAKGIDWAATIGNISQNIKVVFLAINDIALVGFEFVVQNIKKTIMNIPQYFLDVIDWMTGNLWPWIKDFGKTLWDPIKIGAQIIAKIVQLKFQEMWVGIKKDIADGVQFFVDKYNSLAETIGLSPISFDPTVDESAVEETKTRLAELKEELLETDIGGAIFGPPEEQIDTIAETQEAINEIIKNTVEQLIILDEEKTESDDEATENQIKNAKKLAAEKAKEFKLTDEIKKVRRSASDQFVSDLQTAGQHIKGFDKIAKAASIASTIRDTYESAQAQFKQFSKSYPAPTGQILGVAAAVAATAAGLARVEAIRKAQYGADFITTGPEMMMVGEGSGPERVQVTPLEDPNIEGPQGQPINVNISGNVMHDSFIEDNVIPSIREGLRLGENMGV